MAKNLTSPPSVSDKDCHLNLSRRNFLIGSGTVILLQSLPSVGAPLKALQQNYQKKRIALVKDLKQDKPIKFRYPHDDMRCTNTLIKLGEEAAAGVGVDKDIVAFNNLCPHMGGSITDVYNSEHKVAGPCPLHLTTYDLTHHGMVISGHATESLPQIMLTVEKGVIYATSVMGLIFSFHDNHVI